MFKFQRLKAVFKIRLTQNSFTLVEVLVAISIAFVLLTALYTTFITANQSYRKTINQSELTQNARIALERISRDIRQADNIVTELPPVDAEPPEVPGGGEPISETVNVRPDGPSVNTNYMGHTPIPAGPNYTTIDEESTNDSDYIYGSGTDAAYWELFTLSPNVPSGATVTNVTLHARHKESFSGASRLFVFTGTIPPTRYNLPIQYNIWAEDTVSLDSKPSGGSWTVEDINNLEIGVRLIKTDEEDLEGRAYLSQYYATISYTITPPEEPFILPPSNIQFQDGHETSQIRYIKYYLESETTNLRRQVIHYYFSSAPDTWVSWNTEDQFGNAPEESIDEDAIKANKITSLKFYGVKVIYVDLVAADNQSTYDFKTAVLGRNIR